MKKLLKKVASIALASLLVAAFAGCSNSTGDDDPADGTVDGTVYKNGTLAFEVSVGSTNGENTVVTVKYSRSAKGADELIKISDAEFNIYVNDEKTATYKKIEFELDKYGDSFDDNHKAGDEITSNGDIKDYKATLSVKSQVRKGDKVKVELAKGTIVKVGSAAKAKGSDLLFALIDIDEKVGFYKDLVGEGNYKKLEGLDEDEKKGDEGGNGSVTFKECKKIEVTATENVGEGNFAFVFQIDNDGSKDENGLKIDITDLEMEVKVGNNEAFTVKKDKLEMVPNQWAAPVWSKTDVRFKLSETGAVKSGEKITVQIKKATVSNSDKAGSIIYAFQKDGGDYGMYVSDDDNYKSPFEDGK